MHEGKDHPRQTCGLPEWFNPKYVMEPQLKEISPGGEYWSEAWRLYESSFPPRERRTAEAHLRAVHDPAFRTLAATGRHGFEGLLFYWDAPDFIYMEHLAVEPARRGEGLGSRILRKLIGDNPGRRIILEIDPPVDEISIRRLEFYRRMGFTANGFDYIHPSYRTGARAEPHSLVLMSYPSPMSDAEFRSFTKFISRRVLSNTN